MLTILVDIDEEELDELIDRVARDGGSMVLYLHVYSLGVITWVEEVFAYVPPGGGTLLRGLKHAFISLLVGPWSATGPIFVLVAAIMNLTGGFQTSQYAHGSPELEYDLIPEVNSLRARWGRVFAILFAMTLVTISVVAIWLLVRSDYWPIF